MKSAWLICWLAVLGCMNTGSYAQVVVTGSLLGTDGLPMQLAHVAVMDGPIDTSLVVPADADGRFAFTLSEPGGYGMYLMGVHHEMLEIPFVVMGDGPVELEVLLAPAVFFDDPDSLYVVSPGVKQGVLMERRADGTFAAQISVEADTLTYQILGIKTTAFNKSIGDYRNYRLAGTQMDRLYFDHEGTFWDHNSDYFSLLEVVGGAVNIVFDPSMVADDEKKPVVRATPQMVADIAAVYLDVDERAKRFTVIHRAWQKGAFSDEEWWQQLDGEQHPIRQRLAQSDDLFSDQQVVRHNEGLLQQWILLRYMDRLHPTEADSVLGYRVLEEVPPTSPFWSYFAWKPFATSNMLYLMGRITDDLPALLHYIDQVIDQHPDLDVRTQFRYAGTGVAVSMEDSLLLWRYYDEIMATQPDVQVAENLRRRFAKDRGMQVGNPMPDFSFIALGDSSTTYTSEQLRGKVYLMDVWGTWCAPCVAEVPFLEAAYDQYREQGLEILSVAFVDDQAAIEAFREEEYPMPWYHTLVVREDDEAGRARFEVTGFPRPILVDKQGTIIAIDRELRGEKLNAVLARIFGGE